MRDTRYDVWESGSCSWCQGAVQEIELVPKTEVGGMLKLNRGERPPTGQSEEALWFRCRFRRQFQSSATKVPFSEAGLREGDFRLATTKVPFSEVGFRRGERGLRLGTNGTLRSEQDTAMVLRSAFGAGWVRGVLTSDNTQGLGTAVTAPYPRRSSRNSDAGSTPVTRR